MIIINNIYNISNKMHLQSNTISIDINIVVYLNYYYSLFDILYAITIYIYI